LPVWKLERIVMRPWQILVDLTEDSRGETGTLPGQFGRDGECKFNRAGKRKLGSRENANRRRGVFGRGKASRAGAEVARRQRVTDFCGTRLDVVQTVVAQAEQLLF
jgi:hypothetical protein